MADCDGVFINAQCEQRLIRKLDLYIIPLAVLMYTCNFLDRINIGNAGLYSMDSDLHLVGSDFQLAVSVLFITHCALEVPATLLVRKFRPNRFLAIICIGWSICSTLTGIVQNLASLIALRLLLGIFEAGLFPVLVTLLSVFYTRDRLATRISYVFVSTAIAGAVGGLLAYAVERLDGVDGLHGWRWILILEGIPVFALGLLAFFFFPNDPRTTSILSQDEKKLHAAMCARQSGATASGQDLHWADVRAGATDWVLILFCIAQFCTGLVVYSFSTFLPTIVNGVGDWGVAKAEALTVPVYALGAISYLVVARLSDYTQQRGVFVAGCAALSNAGYVILHFSTSSIVSYVGCFIVSAGMYGSFGLAVTWLPSNCPRYGKRALVTAVQITIAGLSGIVAPFLFPTKEAPEYHFGYTASMVALILAAGIFLFMSWYWRRRNRRRAAGLEDSRVAGMDENEIHELGDLSPRFVYHT